MKIGLVIDYFNPRGGGAEWWTHQFAAYLLRHGHEVHLVTQNVVNDGHALPIVPHCLGRIRSPLSRAEAAEAKLRELKLDLIHDMGTGWYCDVLQPHIGCWSAIARQKLLWTPAWLRTIKRRVDPWLPHYRELQILAARQAAAGGRILLVLAHKVAREYQQYHHVPPERMRVIYNGVDVDRFSPRRRAEYRRSMRERLGLADHVVLALAVAQNFQRKGVLTMLRALEILASRKLPLHAVIVGGKRSRSWQRWADARRLPATFVGAQSDTVPYYAAADIFVHPTFYDNCSLALLEAAASGLPSIVSREDGAVELLTDGREGLVIDDPADAVSLASKMELLLDATRREQMGAAARSLAEEHTMERNCEEIMGVYRQLAPARERAA